MFTSSLKTNKQTKKKTVTQLWSLFCLQVAKWVGDIFNDGIYDAHIKLRKTPFLEWESPHHLDKLIAADVMNSSSKKLCYLNPISKVGDIVDLLYSTKHSAFLVVSPCEANVIPVESKIVHRSSRYGWQPPKIGQRRSVSPSNWSNEPGNTFSLPSSKRQRTSKCSNLKIIAINCHFCLKLYKVAFVF